MVRPGTPPLPAILADGGLELFGDGQCVGLSDTAVDGLTQATIVIRRKTFELRTWSKAFDLGIGPAVKVF